MNQELIIQYAPLIIVVISVCIQYKIFLTPGDFQKLRADFIQYMAEHYVPYVTYRESHRELQEQLSLLRGDINEVKALLMQKNV